MEQEKFQEILKMFMQATDINGNNLKMNNLLIKKKQQTFLHNFTESRQLSDVRSISKTILTVALGTVIKLSKAGKYPAINEETYILPIIKHVINIENKANKAKLNKVKIKHLLTHTIGYEDVLLMRDDIVHLDPFEYLNYIINYPIVHEPGEYYLYSNAGFYLLGVVLQEFLQEDLLIFVNRELFKPLGIHDFTWEKYGNYIAGATRLWLHPESLLKIGELFLNNGKVNDKQLISEQWLQKMITINHYTTEVDTPEATFRRYAYGYGIWLGKEPFYFGHGTDGQTLTIIPDKETIIITLANQPDIKPIERIIDSIIKNKI